MPHVGDVHHVLDLVPVEFEHTAQNILKEIGAQVADVGVVVDGKAAGVQLDLGRREGGERPYFSLVSIKQG